MRRTVRKNAPKVLGWISLLIILSLAGPGALAGTDGSHTGRATPNEAPSEQELYDTMVQAKVEFEEIASTELPPGDEAARQAHEERMDDITLEIWRATMAWCEVSHDPHCY